MSILVPKPASVSRSGPAVAQGEPGRGSRRLKLAHTRELIAHLVIRELTAIHRWTLLGWTWPLARQLAQLGVLVLIFGHVVNLGIRDYPVFVFSGLVMWTWFSAGVGAASSSVVARRHLVFQPRCPPVVLPVVAAVVPLVDVLIALPVLIVMLVLSGSFHWTIVVLPALLGVQLLLMVGLGWITAALGVYLRDIPNIVGIALITLFYGTPVFFSIHGVPSRFHALLLANPIGTLMESYRAVILGTPFPPPAAFAGAVAASVVIAALGLRAFRALEPGFVDEL